MLDYKWGNSSTMMVTGDDVPTQDSDRTPHFFTPFSQNFSHNLIIPTQNAFNNPNHQSHFHHTETQTNHFQSLYDPRSYGASYPPRVMMSHESVHSSAIGHIVVPKIETVGIDYTSRIGLNLGGRTYFSSAEDDFVNRIYRRSSTVEPGSVNSPRCQAEGCNIDLTNAKHYHRRHKVCEFHSKAATVIAAGLIQRFCQQCSRFHLLTEFDNRKRSCRKRLADHNRRRRKTNQSNQDHNKSQLEIAHNSSSKNLAGSPPDSGVNSSSLMTVAISPPRISLDHP